jgi:hypothetical protein
MNGASRFRVSLNDASEVISEAMIGELGVEMTAISA